MAAGLTLVACAGAPVWRQKPTPRARLRSPDQSRSHGALVRALDGPKGRLTLAGAGLLQGLVGNSVVTQLIADNPVRVGVQRGDADPATTAGADDLEPWIVRVQGELTGLGVSDKELGAPDSYRELGESESQRLLRKLRQYKAHSGLVFTSSKNIIKVWNSRRDDLGVGGRSGYETILHYVRAMEGLANDSLGGDWPDNLLVMSEAIRIGGAKFHVHPRMLYFAAAAQVGMNAAAGLDSGEGHYLAPAAVFEELRLIRKAAMLVDDLAAELENAHAASGSTGPVPGPDGVTAVYSNLARRLKHLAEVRAHQTTSASGSRDHPEPLARYMDEAMATEIERLPTTATDDADAVTRCRDIMVLLWYKPQKRQAHGWGAADPHGTHHALGMAMDAYYGTAQGGYANSFKFLQGDAAANIAMFLVDEYGAEYDLTPSNPKALVRHIRADPEAGRAFALMLRDHAADALALLERSARESKDPGLIRLAQAYQDLRRSTLRGLRVRHGITKTVLGDRRLMRAVPALKPYVVAVVGEQSPARVAQAMRPSAFLAAAQTAAGAYEGLRVTLELTAGAATKPDLDPTAAPDVATPLRELDSDLDALEHALAIKQTAALGRRMPAGFRRVLDRAAAGTLVLDQPLEVLKGFASVQGARLQSGHHFQVTGWQAMLRSRDVYTSKVAADMATRTPDAVQDILRIMAQTTPGYEAVFGAETARASIVPALREWAATSTVDIDAMLDEVHDSLPPPSIEGLDAKRKQLVRDLYSRGFYDAALTVASPKTTGP